MKQHNINATLPWTVCEPHARMHGMSTGQVVATPHHTPVTRFATEGEALAYLTERNAADERMARLGSVNPSKNSKRYIAFSTMTYDEIMAVHREREAIEAFATRVIAMTQPNDELPKLPDVIWVNP